METALTVLLAGSECAFTCTFCDLWKHTLDRPTPVGAIPAQIAAALQLYQTQGRRGAERVKLYNASNFFDPRAVPPDDYQSISSLLRSFDGVTVETHAKTVGQRCFRFAADLPGQLEVALGLETVHPDALPRLNKKMSLSDFDRAAASLDRAGIDLRAFVILGTPFIPAEATVEWTVRSVDHALQAGAAVVSIIPARGGNGEMERLAALGEFHRPTLRQLEDALQESRVLEGGTAGKRAVVLADLWDALRLPGCDICRLQRLRRLRALNESDERIPPLDCPACD